MNDGGIFERWGRESATYEAYSEAARDLLATDERFRAARDEWETFFETSHGDVFADVAVENPLDRLFVDALYYDFVVDRIIAVAEREFDFTLANREPRANTDALSVGFRELHRRVADAGSHAAGGRVDVGGRSDATGPAGALADPLPDELTKADLRDAETEFLTRRGWIKGENLRDDDRFAILNQNTFELEFQEASHIYAFDYEGKMYRLENEQLDLKVMPNHRMWTQRRGPRHLSGSFDLSDPEHRDSFEMRPAMEIEGEARRYLKAAKWDGRDPGEIHIQEGTSTTGGTSDGFRVSSENWARFMGWFLSEGYAYCPPDRYQYITGICQDKQKNPKNYAQIVSLLDNIGVTYQTCSDGIRIYHKGLYTRLKKFGGSNEKYVPDQVKNMPVGHLNGFMDALIKGDGYKYVNKKTYHHGSVGYHTVSRRLADDIQEIAIKLGMSANIKKDVRPQKYKNGLCYYFSLSDRKYAPWVNWSDESKESQTEEWVDYDGKVYSATVSGGTLMVRRNDKSVVGGSLEPASATLQSA